MGGELSYKEENRMQPKVVTLLFVSVLMGVLLAPGLVLAAGYANSDLLIETAQLENMLNDPSVRVVDARPNGEYKKGHIPGAVNLSYQEIDDPKGQVENELLPTETLATMLGDRGIGKDTKVVFYDASGGFRAARLFWMMEYLGHRKVAILNGGYPKWVKEGRNVTKKAPTVEKARFPMSVTPRKLATADWLVDRQNNKNVVVIDVRGPGSYNKGHIPWAKNIPWKGNINADKTVKSADELNQHFASKGVTKDKNVAVHCQEGRAAAHSYFTLRLLGYPRVRSYDRSWAEWGLADDLPKTSKASTGANPCSAKNPCAPK